MSKYREILEEWLVVIEGEYAGTVYAVPATDGQADSNARKIAAEKFSIGGRSFSVGRL